MIIKNKKLKEAIARFNIEEIDITDIQNASRIEGNIINILTGKKAYLAVRKDSGDYLIMK